VENIDETEVQQKAEPTKWFAIRTGAGKMTGYIEMFWADALLDMLGFPALVGLSTYLDCQSANTDNLHSQPTRTLYARIRQAVHFFVVNGC
jgi:hypothetical protein